MFYLYVLAHMCPVENIAPVVRPYGGKNDEKLWQLKFYKRQTRALHLILQSQIAKQKPATPRTIVVSKNVKTNEEIMVWAGGFGIPVEIVESEHMVHSTAEVVAWLKYIVENYENLPEHVVFLTDSGPDWHSKPDWSSRIKNAAPACREALGITLADKNVPEETDIMSMNLYLKILADTIYDPRLSDGICCSEGIISRGSIRQYPLDRYKILLDIVYDNRFDEKRRWGFAFERSYSQLFNYCPTKPLKVMNEVNSR